MLQMLSIAFRMDWACLEEVHPCGAVEDLFADCESWSAPLVCRTKTSKPFPLRAAETITFSAIKKSSLRVNGTRETRVNRTDFNADGC